MLTNDDIASALLARLVATEALILDGERAALAARLGAVLPPALSARLLEPGDLYPTLDDAAAKVGLWLTEQPEVGELYASDEELGETLGWIALDIAPLELERREPAWADVDAVRAACLAPYDEATAPRPLSLARHLAFGPWRRDIARTAALAAQLRAEPLDAATDRAVSRSGDGALLGSPEIPRCRGCGEPLTFCFQFSSRDLAPWLAIDGMLTGFYCFGACMAGPDAAHISVEPPAHLVRGASDLPLRALCPVPLWMFPADYSRLLEGGAAARWRRSELIDWGDEYNALVWPDGGWVSRYQGGASDTGGRRIASGREDATLGGFPRFAQLEDLTPACDSCGAPMALLVDFNGDLFVDGSMHVFTCQRTAACIAAMPLVAVVDF